MCDFVIISGCCLCCEASQLREKLDMSVQGKHLLYAGTELVRTNNFQGEVAMAYVLRTGFMTSRGQMIRSMLHPKPIDLMFYKVCEFFTIQQCEWCLLNIIANQKHFRLRFLKYKRQNSKKSSRHYLI